MPFIKRIFDITVCIILIPIALPLFIIIFVLNYIILGRPVLFLQKRPGYKEKLFTFIKFRTMFPALHKDEIDDKRIPTYGRFLRKYSIDEIPTFINVLTGDMSLVGPRPLLPEYLPLYSDEQKRRHDVVPGITGLAQISGRNALSWKRKLRYDSFYASHRSFKMDLYILCKTVSVTLFSKGISHSGHATMPKFNGDK